MDELNNDKIVFINHFVSERFFSFSGQNVGQNPSSLEVVLHILLRDPIGGQNVAQKILFQVVSYQYSGHFVVFYLFFKGEAGAFVGCGGNEAVDDVFSLVVGHIFLEVVLVGVVLLDCEVLSLILLVQF